MPYDVITDDLYDNNPKPPAKKTNWRGKPKKDKYAIKPMYIHAGIIILLLLLLLVLLLSGIMKSFADDRTGVVTIVGQVDEFDKSYFGDITMSSGAFILETPGGSFEDSAKDIEITAFNGRLYFDNRSIILSGTSTKVKYGGNTINLDGANFKLNSSKKTTLSNLVYEDIGLSFSTGTAKLDSNLKYDFENSDINLTNFNMSMSYDGTFSFSGKPDDFEINSPDADLRIVYDIGDE